MVESRAVRPGEGMLPQNIEAEQAVLGSLLIDPRAVERIASFLRPEDFYLPVNAEIYRGMLALYERDMPSDIVTLSDHLEAQGRLDDMGGAAYLASLATIVPTSINVEHYARIVERLAVLRRLVDAGNRISAIGYDERLEADAALEEAERVLFEISRLRVTRDFQPLASILAEVYEKIDHIHSHESEVTGIPTGFIDLDRLTSGFQRSDLIILAARPSMGKCVAAHTLIDHPVTGRRLTVAEYVRDQQAHVLGLSPDGRIRAVDVTDWIDSGIKPTLRVTTRTGRRVEVTAHHPFLTVRGWVPLHDLQPGEKIAVPRAVPAFGQDESMPLGLVRLLAYCIAEGGLTDKAPKFTNTDPVLIADFIRIIAEHFPECRVRQQENTYIVSRPRSRARVPNPLTEWLRSLGPWGKLSEQRSFPACVWTWTRPRLAEFLRVLFSCDGTIYPLGGFPRIEFSVASEALAHDAQHALLRFGVVSKLWRKKDRCWRVEITEPDSVQTYQDQIGWIGAKAIRCRFVPVGHRRSNLGHVPPAVWPQVRAAARSRGMSTIELARRSGEIPADRQVHFAGYNPHARRSLPRQRLPAYASVLQAPDLQRLASPDIYWDELVAIEPAGEQQVYDLTVPDGANFIAQDICVHNTALALNVAHSVAIKSGLPVGIFSVEMSGEQLAHRLISLQSQVDSQKLRNGRMSDSDWDRLVQAVGILSEAPIFVDDTPALSTVEMRSKSRRLHSEQGLGLIIVDYLQLMQGASSENRVQEISAISRGLKAVARELDVPVLALSQLSRAPEQRPNHEPMLSDLRESGCLAGDSLVYLADQGTYRRIDELVGDPGHQALAVDTASWHTHVKPIVRAFPTGRKPIFRLTTRTGRTIRATVNHRFLTVDGWQALDQLTVGREVALPRRTWHDRHPSMTDAELALLGHLIGDGCTLPRHAIQYVTTDPVLADIVGEAAHAVFGDSLAVRMHREPKAGHEVRYVDLTAAQHLTHGVRNPVAEWLTDLGVFGLRSYEKRVPERVFAQPDSGVACFLRHLWATDGCIRLVKQHPPAVYYASSSECLARDVQSLLLRLGIMSALRRWPQPKKGRDQFHVVLSGKPDLGRFLDVVGAVGSQKVEHAESIRHSLDNVVANTNRDIIPKSTWRSMVVPAPKECGITARQLQAAIGTRYCGSTLYKSNLGRERAERVAIAIRSRELAQLAQSDVFWDPIASIEPDGVEDVYDLTVDGLHNFVANDIIVHNSIEQDADVVMFIYRDVVYNKETERPHVADVLVAKHRNGPTGKIHLFFQESLMKFLDLSAHGDD